MLEKKKPEERRQILDYRVMLSPALNNPITIYRKLVQNFPKSVVSI